jgi:hypothetical protein
VNKFHRALIKKSSSRQKNRRTGSAHLETILDFLQQRLQKGKRQSATMLNFFLSRNQGAQRARLVWGNFLSEGLECLRSFLINPSF